MLIKYKIIQNSNGMSFCETPCPYRETFLVGSFGCAVCDYYCKKGETEEFKYIICKHVCFDIYGKNIKDSDMTLPTKKVDFSENKD